MKKVICVFMAVVIVALTGHLYIIKKNQQAEDIKVSTCTYNQKVVEFTKMFITKVLKSDAEVSFEDRLKLENTVRDLNDKFIFDQWQKFINAKTPQDAQIEVKNLLELLINKIKS